MSIFNFIYDIKLKSDSGRFYLTVYKQKEFKDEDDISRYINSIIKTLSLPSDSKLESLELHKGNSKNIFTKYILSKISR